MQPPPTTAAVRSGGRPPSHSHCSSTHGQIRSVTSPARNGEGSATRGKVSGAPARMWTLTGLIFQPSRARSEPVTAIGTTGFPLSSANRPTPRLGRCSEPVRIRVPSGNITTASPRSSSARAVATDSSSDSPRRTGKAPMQLRNQPISGFLKSSCLATK